MTVEFENRRPGAAGLFLAAWRLHRTIQFMSDREILSHRLAAVAARLGWSRRLPELGRLACALAALTLAGEVLQVLGLPSRFLSALTPVFLVTALAVSALFLVRIVRPATLSEAAGAADARGGLKDELKSAHWFAQGATADAFVEALLARAARTAQTLEVSSLIPLGVPRSAHAALVIAILTGALAWLSPRLSFPGMVLGLVSTQAATAKPAESRVGENEPATASDENRIARKEIPEATSLRDQKPTWEQIEELAGQLPAGAEEEAMRRAVAARDARLVAKLLQSLRHKQADAAEMESMRRPGDEPIPSNLGQGSLERLQEALEKSISPVEEPLADLAAEPTARVTQQLRDQAEEERRKMAGTPAEGDVELNPRMRAVNRGGVSMREVKYGAGEAAEAGARTSVDGNAMGPPDGKGRSGGSSGEHPESSFTASDVEPVLGAPTVRLEVQSRRARIERSDDPEQQATKEEFYAETQRRASQLGYEDLSLQWRAQREARLLPGQTPLPYRQAVKRYFLTQHDKEEHAE